MYLLLTGYGGCVAYKILYFFFFFGICRNVLCGKSDGAIHLHLKRMFSLQTSNLLITPSAPSGSLLTVYQVC